jgi:hypothetical protein
MSRRLDRRRFLLRAAEHDGPHVRELEKVEEELRRGLGVTPTMPANVQVPSGPMTSNL